MPKALAERQPDMSAIGQKISRSWQLFKCSVRVIRDHPKLLAFPMVTGVITGLIALFFLAPVALVLVAPHVAGGTWLQGLADSIGFVRFGGQESIRVQVQPLGTIILACA